MAKSNNPEQYPVCVHCPYYKSVADYEMEVKAYGKEKAYQCIHRKVCGYVLRFSGHST